MKPWSKRPRELRNLFNPAFCGIVILRAIIAYKEEKGKGMPFSLTLLLLPLCLHKDSRETIRRGVRSYLIKIVEENPQIMVGLPGRTRSLLPYTFEALGLMMHLGALTIESDGTLHAIPKCLGVTVKGTDESKACQSAASSLGKKFAAIGDRVTIYTTLGVRP